MRKLEKDNDAWSLDRGATVLPDGSVRFSVWAPNARRVAVQLLKGTSKSEHELERVTATVYQGVVPDARGADYSIDQLSRFLDRGVQSLMERVVVGEESTPPSPEVPMKKN